MPNLGMSESVKSEAMQKLSELKEILAKEDIDLNSFIQEYASEEPMEGSDEEEAADASEPSEPSEEEGGSPKKALIIAMLKAKNKQ